MSFSKIIDDFHTKKKNELGKSLTPVQDEFSFNFSKDKNDYNIIEIYDDKGNFKLKAQYSVLGLYNTALSVWYWRWSLSYINKDLTQRSKLIKKYKSELIKKYKNDKFK